MVIPGQLDDPRTADCHTPVIAACKRHGKVAGIVGLGGRRGIAERVLRRGDRFLTAGIDWDLMLVAARQRVQSLRDIEGA